MKEIERIIEETTKRILIKEKISQWIRRASKRLHNNLKIQEVDRQSSMLPA